MPESKLWEKVCKLFHYTLGLSFTDYVDSVYTMLCKKPKMDIGKFDDILHEWFGQYEDEGLSMYDILVKNFGESIAEQIKELV